MVPVISLSLFFFKLLAQDFSTVHRGAFLVKEFYFLVLQRIVTPFKEPKVMRMTAAGVAKIANVNSKGRQQIITRTMMMVVVVVMMLVMVVG